MNHHYTPAETDRVVSARDSFSGRLLTNSQFDEAMSITGIIQREIKKSGAFKDKLGDYAHAFARSEKYDAMKAETVIRDLFKERCGQTMNKMREGLMEREQNLTDVQRKDALGHAREVSQMIEQGNKMPFHRAYAHQAQILADNLDITDAGAKNLMKDEFKNSEGKELYDWGKELEEKYYRPQIEAEKQQREASKTQTRSRQRA